MSSEDDVYNGFFIPKGLFHLVGHFCDAKSSGPKGSMMVANAWYADRFHQP